MIYREHPSVGAILHIHAWMEDIASTRINYPCGTIELATGVADLVRQAPDPGHAVIGLRNHGLTITGEIAGRDLRPHRRQDPAPGADGLSASRVQGQESSVQSRITGHWTLGSGLTVSMRSVAVRRGAHVVRRGTAP